MWHIYVYTYAMWHINVTFLFSGWQACESRAFEATFSIIFKVRMMMMMVLMWLQCYDDDDDDDDDNDDDIDVDQADEDNDTISIFSMP